MVASWEWRGPISPLPIRSAFRRLRTGRLVVLEVFPGPGQPQAIARLRQEAEAAAGLDHPHISLTLQVGETPDGRVFVARPQEDGDPGVKEAAVVGRPDADLGQVPVAFLVVEAPIDESALIAFCREQMAAFKVPREIRTVESLPRNALGKVQKHLL